MLNILTALTVGFAIYGVIEATRRLRVTWYFPFTFKKQVSCPECDGTNLNTENTKCWDCAAADCS